MSSASDRTALALVAALRLSITVFHLVCYNWASQRLQRLYRVALARAKSCRLCTPAQGREREFYFTERTFCFTIKAPSKRRADPQGCPLDAVPHSGGREIGY